MLDELPGLPDMAEADPNVLFQDVPIGITNEDLASLEVETKTAEQLRRELGLPLSERLPLMQRHELDALTDTFVQSLQARLPQHLSSFGPATPERLRDASRAHVEAIIGDGSNGNAMESVAALTADLLRLFSMAPAPTSAAAPAPEAAPEAAPKQKG